MSDKAGSEEESIRLEDEGNKGPEDSLVDEDIAANQKTFLELLNESFSGNGGKWFAISAIGSMATEWDPTIALSLYRKAFALLIQNGGNQNVDPVNLAIAVYHLASTFQYRMTDFASRLSAYFESRKTATDSACAILTYFAIRMDELLNSINCATLDKVVTNINMVKNLGLSLPNIARLPKGVQGGTIYEGKDKLDQSHLDNINADIFEVLADSLEKTVEGSTLAEVAVRDQVIHDPGVSANEDFMKKAAGYFNFDYSPTVSAATSGALAATKRTASAFATSAPTSAAAPSVTGLDPLSDEPLAKAAKTVTTCRKGFLDLMLPDVEGLTFSHILPQEVYELESSLLYIPERAIGIKAGYEVDYTLWNQQTFRTRRSFAIILAVDSLPFKLCCDVFEKAHTSAEGKLKQIMRIAALHQIAMSVAFGTGLNTRAAAKAGAKNVLTSVPSEIRNEYSRLLKKFEDFTGLPTYTGDTREVMDKLMQDGYAMSNFTQSIAAFVRTTHHNADYPRFARNTLRNFCFMSTEYGKEVKSTGLNARGEMAVQESVWHPTFKAIIFRHSIHCAKKAYAIRGVYDSGFRTTVGFVLNGPDEYSLKAPAFGSAVISTMRAAIDIFSDIPDEKISRYKTTLLPEKEIIENINSLEKFKWSKLSSLVLGKETVALPKVDAYLAKFCGSLVALSNEADWRRTHPQVGKLDAPSLKIHADPAMKRKITEMLQIQTKVGTSGLATYLSSQKGSVLLDDLMKLKVAQVAEVDLARELATEEEEPHIVTASR